MPNFSHFPQHLDGKNLLALTMGNVGELLPLRDVIFELPDRE